MRTTTCTLAITIAAASLSGCAATYTLINKKDLDVQTKTSTAVFVEPVARPQRTIYLDVKSGVTEFDRRSFKQAVTTQFAANNDGGYRLVDDPDQAQFAMTAFVLNLEKASPAAAEQALGRGYMGGAVLAGAGAVGLATDSWRGAAAGGLAGGAAELVTGALVKDVTYMLVCDVQIKERAAKGVVVRKDTQLNAKVADASTSRQTVSEVSDKKEYRTRIVTTANKANLKLEDAQGLMIQKTASAIVGFF